MRRFRILLTLLPLLVFPVRAQMPRRYAALAVESGPNAVYTRQLLDGLYDRGIRVTFLLQGSTAARQRPLLDRMLTDGHEIACRGYTGENMTAMSRRAVAGEILDFQALLPEGYPLRLFCPPGGCSDPVRQVAEARKLAILSWSGNAAAVRVSDGDILLLKDSSEAAVAQALALADRLLEEGFRFLSVSDLARLRQAKLIPGKIYSRFPPPE